MTSQESLGGSCSPPPNPPAPLASIQQEMKPNSSDSSIEQQHRHHAVVMEGSVTPPTLPSISTNRIYVGTFTPSSTLSAIRIAAGSSGSATTATTATNGTTTTSTAHGNNQRRELSFDERIQVIQLRSSGKSLIQLAIQFGCGRCGKTQILNILGQREAYLKEWKNWKQAELLSNLHIGE